MGYPILWFVVEVLWLAKEISKIRAIELAFINVLWTP